MSNTPKSGTDRVIEILELHAELLRSIDHSLKSLAQRAAAKAPKAIADDRDLDSQYGNPQVRFDPRDWSGSRCKGKRMSECPPEFLDMYADAKEFFGQKAEKEGKVTDKNKPVAPYEYKDAARARGWAKRIREGKQRMTPSRPADTDDWASESRHNGW